MFKLRGRSLHNFYKKALSAVLSLSVVVMTLPTVLKTDAAIVNETDNPAFSVTAYDTSARIDIPAVVNATCYRVYLSQTKDADIAALTADTSARCVFSSSTYKSYDYVLSGDTDELNSANTVSISQNTAYYFYLVTNDGNADTLKATAEASTKATADCYWTSGGHYDISWYTANPKSDTYTISTEAQFAGLAVLNNGLNGVSSVDFSGKTITISESLDLSAWLWTPIGTESKPFKGNVSGVILDANNKIVSCTHTIKGLHTNSTNNYQGLFGEVGGTSTITDIGVVDGYVQGNIYTAGIAGEFRGSAIRNSFNTCFVRGKSSTAGGIAGSTKGSITSCYNTGSIFGTDNIGGVVGNSEGAMLNCYNTGSVSGYQCVGGVVGFIRFSKSRLYACYNMGTVTASCKEAGGIAGCSELSPIDSCYNSGSIYSDNYAAGIVGAFNYTGNSLTNSYNIGSVNGNYRIGGICGVFGGDSIDNCYNAGNVADNNDSGEITAVIDGGGTVNNCYYNSDTAYSNAVGTTYGTGKTPAELKALAGTLGTAFVQAPVSYANGGVFSGSNPVNGGYPVLAAFGYTGGRDIDSQFEKESGTGYYLVKNTYQMDLVRNYCGSGNSGVAFKLVGNIDLSKAAYNNFKLCWQPVGSDSNPFCGTFDGGGYGVSGITICERDFYLGLFGYNTGTVKNLAVTDVNIMGFGHEGAVIGYNTGVISNCSGTGTVGAILMGDNIGGIVGNSEGAGAAVSGCCSACAVSGDGWIGGVVGYGDCTITHCSNTGFVTGIVIAGSPGEASEIGGIVGVNSGQSLTGCRNVGKVCGNKNIGGIAGYLTCIDDTVSGCSNTGSVFGKSVAGGIVGSINRCTLKNCYNEGNVTGYGPDSVSIGGIGGEIDVVIQSCYNTGAVTGDSAVGGIAGTLEYVPVSYSYNTGSITGNDKAGGIAGGSKYANCSYCYNIGAVTSAEYAGGILGIDTEVATIRYCYNTGLIQGNSVGGISCSVSSFADIEYNSYWGCDRCIGGAENKNQGGKPFAALASDSIKAAGSTSIVHQNCILEDYTFSNQLGTDFAVAYSGFQSDNTNVAAVSGLKVAGRNVGAAAITGTITITQNELNMQDDSGFTGAVKTITVPVSLPLTVTKATPAAAVSVSSNTVTVGDTLTVSAAISNAYAPTGTVTFYNNDTSLVSTDTINNSSASVSCIPTAAGGLSITAEYSGDTNNTAAASGNTQNVTVTKRSPVLTTVTAAPSTPQTYPITSISLSTTLSNFYGPLKGQTILFYNGNTYLGTALTGGDGKAVYTLTNPGADTYQFTARFGGDSNNNTAETGISTDYTVNKGTQANLQIGGVPSSVIYGDTGFTISSSGGSGTNNTYTYFSNNTDVLSVDLNGTVSIKGAGYAVITVTKAGDKNYNPISKDIPVTVIKKTLNAVITPNNKTYDATADATVKTIDYTGIVGSDNVHIAGGTLSFSDKTAASNKPVIASNYVLGGTKSANYSMGAVNVNPADITKKELAVSVRPVIIDCGQSIPSLSVEIAGFAHGENANNIAGFAKPAAKPIYGSPTTSTVKDVPMNVVYSGGYATNNYEFSYSDIVSLTIRAVAVKDGDYQVSGKYAVSENPADWNTGNFTITPGNGYDLISTDGITWVPNFTIDTEGQNCAVTFKLKKTTDGTQTENNTIYYNLDKTAPTVHVTGNPVDLVKSAKLTIGVTAGASGIKSVNVNGNDITGSYKNGYTVTQNGDYKFTVTNGVGLTEEQTVKVSEIQPAVITNEKTGLAFDLSNANLPSGITSASVSSTILPKSGADSGFYAAVKELIGSGNPGSLRGLTVYDLKLLDQNGSPITNFTGKIKVKIPIPEGMSGTPHIFWYDAAHGSLTDMNAAVENGYLTFETTHFSYYAVAELKTASTSVPNPPTGSGKALLFPLALLGVGSAGFIVVRKRKKYRVKK